MSSLVLDSILEQKVVEVLEFALNPVTEDRYFEAVEIGEWPRQGDVYLVRIESTNPGWKPTTNRQLAIGTTNGSRHTVANSVTVLANPKNGVVESLGEGRFRCLGPQVIAKTRFEVHHPTHGNLSLPPGCYQVAFQVDARSMSRVQD